MIKVNDFPRRNIMVFLTPAETAIYKAMEEVEKLGADSRLTSAIIHLNDAKEYVANYVDEKFENQQNNS